MAIDNKLVHFNQNDTFQERLNANDIKDYSIVFIKDSNTIYTHGAKYQWVGWSELKISVPDGYETFLASNGVFSASDGPFYVKTNKT